MPGWEGRLAAGGVWLVGRGGMLSLRLEVVRMNESQMALCKQPRELIGNLLATEGANRYRRGVPGTGSCCRVIVMPRVERIEQRQRPRRVVVY